MWGPMIDDRGFRGQMDLAGAPRLVSPRVQSNTSTVLISPSEAHRRTLTKALEAQRSTILSVLTTYPDYSRLIPIADTDCDAFVIELDTDNDGAINLVESLCSRKPSATVIVYAASNEPELLIASMRAGAREFLFGEIAPNVLGEALLRAAARHAETAGKRTQGKLLMFWGAKGGSGTSTLATNFAIALREETGGDVALVDFNPELGDVSLLLGLQPRFTISHALLNPSRLDEDFIQTLVTEHRSGLSVFAAPDVYSAPIATDDSTIRNLMDLIGSRFPYTVIDTGRTLGRSNELLFQLASTIYVVTQADIASLRNTQRFISHLQGMKTAQIELVLNRFEARKIDFDDERLSKAVGMAPKWKVPNDYAAARRACNTGTPLTSENTSISHVFRQMARAASGKPAEPHRKKGFSLFG